MIKLNFVNIKNPLIKLKLYKNYKSIVSVLGNIDDFDNIVEVKQTKDYAKEIYVVSKNNKKYYIEDFLNNNKRIIMKDNNSDSFSPVEEIYEYKNQDNEIFFIDIYKTYQLDDKCTFEEESTENIHIYYLKQGYINNSNSVEASELIKVVLPANDELNDLAKKLLIKKIKQFINKYKIMNLIQFHNIFLDIKPLKNDSSFFFSSYYGQNINDKIEYVNGTLFDTNLLFVQNNSIKENTIIENDNHNNCKIISLF